MIRSNKVWLTVALFVFALLAGVLTGSKAQEAGKGDTITVTIHGVKDRKGILRVHLYNDSKGFPADPNKAYLRKEVLLKDIPLTGTLDPIMVTFDNLPPGRYAVCSIHDSNSNNKLDKDWIGKPREDFGVSNNIHAFLRAPHFSEAAFNLAANEKKSLTISIRH